MNALYFGGFIAAFLCYLGLRPGAVICGIVVAYAIENLVRVF